MQKSKRMTKFSRIFTKFELLWLKMKVNSILQKHTSLPETSEFWEMVSAIQEIYVQRRWARKGLQVNLSNPVIFAEKLEWLKINYHNDLLVQISDKLAVRDYVVRKLGVQGEGLLNRIHGVYDSISEINYEDLPHQFVVKTNHWSGNSIICHDKSVFDFSTLKVLEKQVQQRYPIKYAEWPYWHIRPKVFIEDYIEDHFGGLVDYKVFCFNGVPRFIKVRKGESGSKDMLRLFYDTDWNLLELYDANYSKFEGEYPQPASMGQMLEYSKLLSDGLPFVRADFYDISGECRFGELTLYPKNGSGSIFCPDEWNSIIGGWLTLPKPKVNSAFAYGPIYDSKLNCFQR